MFTVLNIGQEIFEAFTKGLTGFQYWGVGAGILIFGLLILKPILRFFDDSASLPEANISAFELTRLHFKFELLKQSIIVKEDILIKNFYNLQYQNINCLLFFTNQDLIPKELELFFEVLLKHNMTSGYIVCKALEADNILFNETKDNFKLTFSERNIDSNLINMMSVYDFNWNLFFDSKLKSDIILKSLDVFDSNGHILKQE